MKSLTYGNWNFCPIFFVLIRHFFDDSEVNIVLDSKCQFRRRSLTYQILGKGIVTLSISPTYIDSPNFSNVQ